MAISRSGHPFGVPIYPGMAYCMDTAAPLSPVAEKLAGLFAGVSTSLRVAYDEETREERSQVCDAQTWRGGGGEGGKGGGLGTLRQIYQYSRRSRCGMRFFVSLFLSFFLSFCLSVLLPFFLSVICFLSFFLSFCISFFLSFFFSPLPICSPLTWGGLKVPWLTQSKVPRSKSNKVSPCRQRVFLASTRCAQKTMRLSEANPKITGGVKTGGVKTGIALP